MPAKYARRHKQFGWWLLFVFATLGLALELLHGFKIQTYLAVSSETRRLMWTLAHAHGVLIALVNVVFGVSLDTGTPPRHLSTISVALIAAGILIPGGFLLAGIAFYDGDPGVAVVFVPVGAVLLLVAVFSLARDAGSAG
jgi:hypothetical protein